MQGVDSRKELTQPSTSRSAALVSLSIHTAAKQVQLLKGTNSTNADTLHYARLVLPD